MVERTRKITSLYCGPTDEESYSRDQCACHRLWNREYNIPHFDNLVAVQIKIALEEARNQVVCLGVGVGKAGLFRSFLKSLSGAEGESATLLRDNPQLNLHLVGFNDAPDKDTFLKNIEPEEIEVPYPNIRLNLVNYTLTRNQTLRQLLDFLNLPQVDQVTATAVLHYLSPKVFSILMEDIVSCLRGKGSRFVGLGYCDYPVGFSVNDGHTFLLNVKELKDEKPDWRRTFRQKSDCFGNDCNLADEKKALSQLIQVFQINGVIRADEIKQLLHKAYDLIGKPFQPLDQTLDLDVLKAFVENLVANINKIMLGQRRVFDEVAKKDILASLKKRYRNCIHLEYGDETIDIKKLYNLRV